MVYEYSLNTKAEEMLNVTHKVNDALKQSGVKNGFCLVFCPHTTAGITINENADPDVQEDLLLSLNKAFSDRREFKHFEGNSSAHAKSSCVGVSKIIAVQNSKLVLGRWQGIYFCEFDGPRNRKFQVSFINS